MGTMTRIGIIEFHEDWFPFKFDLLSNPYVEDSNAVTYSKEDTKSNDRISDTWTPGKNKDLEEGEIEMENADNQTDGGDANDAANSGAGDGSSGDTQVGDTP